jgi:hypothetical protein
MTGQLRRSNLNAPTSNQLVEVAMSDDRFPCLSIRQPFVDYIFWDVKEIENRTRATKFRGTILIHASSGKPAVDLKEVEAVARKWKTIPADKPYSPVLGAIVGMVDIVDCVTESDSEDFEGPYGWVLQNPVRFKNPVPFKGAVGIFYVPCDLLAYTAAAHVKAGAFRRQ